MKISKKYIFITIVAFAFMGCSSNCESYNGKTVERDFSAMQPKGIYSRNTISLNIQDSSTAILKFKDGNSEYVIEYEVSPSNVSVTEKRIYE